MSIKVVRNANGQAFPEKGIKVPMDFFEDHNDTRICWLGNASVLINCHGAVIAIDPILSGSEWPLFYNEMPITEEQIPHLDGILVTHIDGDHYGFQTCSKLKDKCDGFHAPGYVAEDMLSKGLNATEHPIGVPFKIKDFTITLTPADHDWQNTVEMFQFRFWKKSDYCGFRIETPEGRIWLIGDSRLMEEQLHQPEPDVIMFDFSDDGYHIGFDNAVKLANTYAKADLFCYHWGTIEAPDHPAFNGDPTNLLDKVNDPERIKVIPHGVPYIVEKK